MQPKVHLGYNSSLGNSFVGLDWSLDIPTIKRQTDKGFPTYTSSDVFLFSGEELVPLSPQESQRDSIPQPSSPRATLGNASQNTCHATLIKQTTGPKVNPRSFVCL